MRKALNDALSDWLTDACEYDWHRAGRLLERQRSRSTNAKDHIRRECRSSAAARRARLKSGAY
jgi:hypothetical protein